ncbi:bifunctional aspartate kinase/homoserine dehydrogenase I [Buchnera aphidicola (Neophyllaphis podocarpi)]|uniref:bifunctional aspartate kinase/homoserine dehydrogenase I n=1 Tax=Buchnera aphidicola TaxID=9 RepID=UPI0031B86809
MKILKFGGTSLANSKKFLDVANIIVNKTKKEQIAVVLSAPAKTTNNFELLIKKSINNEEYKEIIEDNKKIFLKIIKEIKDKNKDFEIEKTENKINSEFIKIKKMITGIKLLNTCPDKIYAKIISKGEIISIYIMYRLLQSQGESITIINPIKYISTNKNYLDASVNIYKSIKNFNKIKIFKKNIILMAGFIAGYKSKELVVLGRNGSDYSASILAVCLKANHCEIWTDVNGIYTSDPNKVKNTKLLKTISYKEALELSYFGAKVLHPKTILPILDYNIPCTIKNTNNPNFKGTLICKNKNTKNNIKGITSINNVVIFNIVGINNCMQSKTKISKRVFDKLYKEKINIIIITQSSSEHSISFCIREKEKKKTFKILSKEFKTEIKQKLIHEIEVIKNLSIISIIGNKINLNKNIFIKCFYILDKMKANIIALSQSLSNNSISLIINEKDNKIILERIHKEIFYNKRTSEIFLIGIGGVGKALLNQIKKQNKYLKQSNIKFKICGIANSKKIIIDLDGIDIKKWSQIFKQSNNIFDIKKLIEKIKKYDLYNPIIVDCTSSNKIAYKYLDLIKQKCNIVTSNKQANTLEMEYYKNIRIETKKSKCKFLYDTNVGAGLPIIENLQNLLNSGDQLIKFRGILSGSLSYIFGKLDEGVKLSEATKEAKILGYTEPNPKDDLSGIDVARKLLILAREAGYNIEIKDIKIEPLIPKELKKISNTKIFMKKLKELDEFFSIKIKKAQKKGKVLRFIGIINKNGSCHVKIDAVNNNDPLYKIKNGENALAFYTKYYQPIPLVIRGYGAGNEVTAAGVFTDILRTLS